MKKILIISYYFAPENKVASIRYTKIAKYLHKQGFDVSVICASCVEKVDPILSKDCEKINNIYRIMSPKLYSSVQKKYMSKRENVVSFWHEEENEKKNSILTTVKRKVYKALRAVFSYTLTILLDYGAYFSAKKYIKKRLHNEKYDIVISTYGPRCNHMLGHWLKKGNKEIKWVTDFRDPMVSRDTNVIRSFLLRKKEKSYCTDSDEIIGVANGVISEDLKNRFQDKWHLLTNGFDYDDMNYIGIGDSTVRSRNERIIMTYTGALYKDFWRDLRPVFKAIDELDKEGKCRKTDFCIRYAGNDIAVLMDQAKAFGCEEIIENCGYVSREKAILLQKNSDVLLHATWFVKKGEDVLSGKIFEYLMIGKEIISTVSGTLYDSMVKKIISDSKSGICYEAAKKGDYCELKQYIYELYIKKKESGYIECMQNTDVIKQYSYENITKKMIDFLI